MDTLLTIKRPVATEKAAALNHVGKYVFMVERRATKPEIRKAIHQLYHVDVTNVNVVAKRSKSKYYRGLKGKQTGYKKAIVTLRAGQKIDIGP